MGTKLKVNDTMPTYKQNKLTSSGTPSKPKASCLGETVAFNLVPSTRASQLYRVEREEEEHHHSKLGVHAALLWKAGKVTDFTIRFCDSKYPVHKPVLSCYSTYLRNILLAHDAPRDQLTLDLPGVTPEAFETLLYYMYTGHLNLTVQNIGDVYTAARKLGVKKAIEECSDVFTGKTNALLQPVYIYATAKKLNEYEAVQRSLEAMAKHFERIVGTKEFLDLTCDELCEYLGSDEIATRSEIIVFLAVLKWLNERFLEREQYCVKVMKCVRFSLMTLNEVLACHSPPILPGIIEVREIKEMLLKGTCYVAAKTVNEEKHFESYRHKSRVSRIKRVPMLLWDPNIFDPVRYAQYRRVKAATLIQACFRGHSLRKKLKTAQSVQEVAATKIQSTFREYREREKTRKSEHLAEGEEPETELLPELPTVDAVLDQLPEVASKHMKRKRATSTAQAKHRKTIAELETRPKDVVSMHIDNKNRRKTSPAAIFTKTEKDHTHRDVMEEPSVASITLGTEKTKIPSSLDVDSELDILPRVSSSLDKAAMDIRERQQLESSRSDTSKETLKVVDAMLHEVKPNSEFQRRASNNKHMKVTAHDSQPSEKSPVILHKVTTTSFTPVADHANEMASYKSEHSGTDRRLSEQYKTARKTSRNVEDQTRASTDKTISLLDKDADEESFENEAIHVVHRYPTDSKSLTEFKETHGVDSNLLKKKENSTKHKTGTIVVLGGLQNGESGLKGRMMLSYNPTSNSWSELGSMIQGRHHFCAVYLEGSIYCIGGCSSSLTMKLDQMVPEASCFRYDLQTQFWTQIASMNCSRMYHGAAVIFGRIYAVGGKDEDGRILDSIEYYIKEEDSWQTLRVCLENPKYGMGVCNHSDQLWIAGGMSCDSEEKTFALRRIECYDPLDDKIWRNIAKLPSPLCFPALVECHHQVYAIGGVSAHDDEKENFTSLRDVFVYEDKNKKWLPIASLPVPCHFVSAIALGKAIYILNSMTTHPSKSLSRVLVFKEGSESWESCASLQGNFVGATAVLIP